jgi:hypothetical protein
VPAVGLEELHRGFRDDQQRRRAASVVMDRLADDREQEECHHLMRFWWQLSTSTRQVDEAELAATVGPRKLAAVRALISALRSSPEDVDRWIETTVEGFPVIHDRGWKQDRPTRVSPPDEPNGQQVVRQPPRPQLQEPPVLPRLGDAALAEAEAACRAGIPGAAWELGRVLEGRGDLKHAEAAYRLAGETGDPAAFYALGWVLKAQGAPEYRVTAAWQFAADAGFVDAMYALGVFEDRSIGRSDRYLRQAAEAGHAMACYALGYHAFQKRDYPEATVRWSQAASYGLKAATQALADLDGYRD